PRVRCCRTMERIPNMYTLPPSAANSGPVALLEPSSRWGVGPKELRIVFLGPDDAAQVEEGSSTQQVARVDGVLVAVEPEEEKSLGRVFKHAPLRDALLRVAEPFEKGAKFSERDRSHRRHGSPHCLHCPGAGRRLSIRPPEDEMVSGVGAAILVAETPGR